MKGFGGWMWLLLFYLCVIGPFFVLNLATEIYPLLLAVPLFSGLAVYASILLYREKPEGVFWTQVFLISLGIVNIFGGLFAVVKLIEGTTQRESYALAKILITMIESLGLSAFWFLYTIFSRRMQSIRNNRG